MASTSGRSLLEPHGRSRKVEESVRSYDVFINHRGPDVKKTLALQLYNAFERLGIRAFLDSKEKQPGVSFQSTIRTAIQSAKVHIAIFSKEYAWSPWCLEELVLMLNTKAKIIPLFYAVEPSELRHIERGSYHQAFKSYEKKARYVKKRLEEWKGALDKISYVAGYVLKESLAAGDCKEIASAVQKEVQRIHFLHVAKYPVGLSTLVQELESRCLRDLKQYFESQYGLNEYGQGKARIVGIYGMGGTGKTTLSKELFNKYCSKYTRTSFLFDVREAASRSALPSLQLKLLRDLFEEEDHPSFTSTGEGISCLQNRLETIKFVSFLIVLDDIDNLNQLDDLLVTDIRSKPGDSLIIVTTRDAGVLRRADVPTHNLVGLDEDDATKLFCFHAFGQSNPAGGYESLVKDFVKECGGIPLCLQVLGSHVKGGGQDYWNVALRKVRKTVPEEILKKLKISFKSLDREEKQIFMDIACFFIGKSKNVAIKIWEASGWEAHHALETLKEKCLVQDIENKRLDGLKRKEDDMVLGMHDHLRDLGRQMADLWTARRIWKHEDLKSLESKGAFSTIIKKTKSRCFHSWFDKSVGSKIICFLGGKSDSLLWLQLEVNPLGHRSISSWIPLKTLQFLRISKGRLKRLWEINHPAPLQLKELHISETFLEEVPDLTELVNLENVVLDAKYMAIKGWPLLESLRMKISTINWNSSTLEGNPGSLIIRNFQESTDVGLNGLKNLEISCQLSVSKTIIRENHCTSLESLKLHRIINQTEIDLSRLKTLSSLHVNRCWDLKRVSGISNLTKLKKLNISHCPELSKMCLPSLYCLESIIVDGCWKLKCLELKDCKNLETVSGIEDLVELALLNIQDCPELRQLSAHNFCCWERITIDGCEKLDWLLNLKIVAFDIGRAVVGAESILNQSLFSEALVGAEAVTEIDLPCPAIPEDLVSKVLICGLVVVDRSTPLQYINCSSQDFHLPEGRWMVTMVFADPKRNTSSIVAAVEGMCHETVYKGFRVTLMKDQEEETRNVLEIIKDNLYQK